MKDSNLLMTWMGLVSLTIMVAGIIAAFHFAIRPIVVADLGVILLISVPLGYHVLSSANLFLPMIFVWFIIIFGCHVYQNIKRSNC